MISWSIEQRSKKHLNKSLLYNSMKSTPSFYSSPKRQMINDALRNEMTSEFEMKCFAKLEMFAPGMKECVEKKSQNREFSSCEGGKKKESFKSNFKIFMFFFFFSLLILQKPFCLRQLKGIKGLKSWNGVEIELKRKFDKKSFLFSSSFILRDLSTELCKQFSALA